MLTAFKGSPDGGSITFRHHDQVYVIVIDAGNIGGYTLNLDLCSRIYARVWGLRPYYYVSGLTNVVYVFAEGKT
jgi:hypothetical protein